MFERNQICALKTAVVLQNVCKHLLQKLPQVIVVATSKVCSHTPQTSQTNFISYRIDQPKQMPAGSQNCSHTPRFRISKKLNSPALKCFKTRHNIYEATCAKQNEWL